MKQKNDRKKNFPASRMEKENVVPEILPSETNVAVSPEVGNDHYSFFASNDNIPSHETSLPLGDRIRAEREKQGISCKQVSQELRIHIKYIEAIEENSWDVFNNATYARGFIRNYTKLLGLSVEDDIYALFPVISYTHERLKNIDAVSTTSLFTTPKSFFQRIRWLLFSVILLIILFFVGIGLFDEGGGVSRLLDFNFLSTLDNQSTSSNRQVEVVLPNTPSHVPSSDKPTSNSTSQEWIVDTPRKIDETSEKNALNNQRLLPSTLPASAGPLDDNANAGHGAQSSIPSEALESVSSLSDTSNPLPLLTLVSETASPSNMPVHNEQSTVKPAETSSIVDQSIDTVSVTPSESEDVAPPSEIAQENILVIRAGAESWVQVKTLRGQHIFTHTVKKDKILKRKLSTPFLLVIGNAKVSSTSVHYDGKPIHLKRYLTNNGNARVVVR